MPDVCHGIEILFLGTGAADWPVPYCPPADRTQVGAVRGRSSVLIDGQVLIDCGATVPDAIRHFGVDTRGINDILLTHTHGDHCDVDAIRHLVSQRNCDRSVNLWAHPSALTGLPEIDGVCRREVEVGETAELPAVAATALEANHQVGDETPLHFLLRKPRVAALYATDGAWFLKSAWTCLKEVKLDAIIWDATCGETRGNWRIFEHNSIDMINIMRQTLEEEGVLFPRTTIYLTHLSRELCAPHEEMANRLVPQGLIPVYDGLEVTVSP